MDEENAKRKKLEDAAWYQTNYGAQLTKGKKGAKDDFLSPEDIYKLDDDHTYKTLNKRPGTYKGSPGAETLDLGKVKEKPKEVDLTREEDEMSVMTNATNFSQKSREELIEMLREAKISNKGSAPKSKRKPQHNIPGDEESLSNSDDSTLSSSSSEDDDLGSDATGSG